jgi:hypothetical protein
MKYIVKKEELNKFGCKLFIDTGNDHPNIITDVTDIKGSKLEIKGHQFVTNDNKIIENKHYHHNLWIYDTGSIFGTEDIYLHNALKMLLDVMNSKKEKFKEVLSKYKDNHILCYSYFFEVNPYVVLDKDLLQQMAFYNTDVQFDIYCMM